MKNEFKLEFTQIPFQRCCNSFPLSKKEMSINSEIQKLIANTGKTKKDYISGAFTRSKKHGSHRMI